jgi:mannan endo-1,4-beta-mannosidase
MKSAQVVRIVLCCAALLSCTVAVADDIANVRNDVLKYLSGLPNRTDRKVLSGQHAGDAQSLKNPFCARIGYAKYIEGLKLKTGKLVAIAGSGYDVLGAPMQPLSNLMEVNAVVKEHWNRGGLVEISPGGHNPWTCGAANDHNLSGKRLTDAITPGTTANLNWTKQLDDFATALTDLQAAGVVVLWRPFHEFNGSWFWWGDAKDGQDYVKLWRHMHDYLTKTKKLHNLIWVWSGSRESGKLMQPVLKYYPGDAYVDIVGLDMYYDTFDPAAVKAYHDLSKLGKPFALTEYGPDNKTTTRTGTLDLTTLISQIKQFMPNVIYFKMWSDYNGTAGNMYWSIISNKRSDELLNDPWIVNADKVPKFGRK